MLILRLLSSYTIDIHLHQMSCGKKQETMSTKIPTSSTPMVLPEQPFHSFRMMPHTLENTTLRAIRMQKERVVSTGDSVRNPLPNDKPKN